MYAAQRGARRVRGVLSLVDHLEVRLPPADQRTDSDLAGAAMDILRWHRSVPGGRVVVTADDGHLTLTGEVMYQFQRRAADDAVRSLVGVRSVNNQIRIAPAPSAGDVRTQIEQALVRNAHADARNIHIEADHGRLILRGVVNSFVEYDAAETAAWAAPGVREVANDLRVTTSA